MSDRNKAVTQLQKYQYMIVAVGGAVILSIVLAVVGARALGASGNGCTYTIRSGDWLSRIATRNDTTVPRLLELNPRITNPDLIFAGDTIRVCVDGRPELVAPEPELPQHAQRWARLVSLTAPDWASDADVRLMVALAGPESTWCAGGRWNPNDAGWENNIYYVGSYGCVQVRATEGVWVDPHRELAWLREHMVNEAVAAWSVATERRAWSAWWEAWGPTRDGKMPDGTCQGSRWPNTCAEWFDIADQALANVS